MAKTNRKRKQSVAKMSRQIRLEAKALGLTEREYLRLTLALSKALRESFGASSELNTKEFLSFVESPMFSILLRGIVQTALSTITRGASETEDTPDGPPTNPAESPHPSLQAPPADPNHRGQIGCIQNGDTDIVRHKPRPSRRHNRHRARHPRHPGSSKVLLAHSSGLSFQAFVRKGWF
ncbi:hypothetical protein [Alicyclobacillus fastidiosus]|uniref:hypothetical protein n=1 Tax=Alicyclobacillus fastidiosus TaxID=392011 RepID=UPI0023E99935|nr:hypothetical protein [Alicyclobacillus fastidiosus]GMA61851.1 hypothetical protein GCM10025859_22910 [Alicyclobacillus fastidiosus]